MQFLELADGTYVNAGLIQRMKPASNDPQPPFTLIGDQGVEFGDAYINLEDGPCVIAALPGFLALDWDWDPRGKRLRIVEHVVVAWRIRSLRVAYPICLAHLRESHAIQLPDGRVMHSGNLLSSRKKFVKKLHAERTFFAPER